MKRYLAFSGDDYYPLGGMEDYIGDFDKLEDATAAVVSDIEDHDWGYEWGNVWDCVEEEECWEYESEPDTRTPQEIFRDYYTGLPKEYTDILNEQN